MINKLNGNNTRLAEPLFNNWQESLIWSCLQGILGEIYVKDQEKILSAMAILGDFCYLAGIPDKELALYKPEGFKGNFVIMVPQNKEWEKIIEECYQEKAVKVTRYAIKKEPGIFDNEKLKKVIEDLPSGFTLKLIDEELYYKCREIEWCMDWVDQYEDYEIYKKYGLGAVILKDGEPVSGASSYSGYKGGIEIEIGTREDYRRRGLAYICGAKLILECVNRGLYPNWDAQNKWSVALAEKLGYHYDHDYTAYEIRGY